jgi:UDP-hydrolysing UDP-N-acetyl-D-glucosamine 2-epimerase
MIRRKICVVTGSRAEYGLLYWLLREITEDAALDLQLAVTGMHLSQEFGLTYRHIEGDGFAIDAKVDMQLSGDSAAAISKSMATGLAGFADAFEALQPDVVVVLGDRFEIFAAAQAAMMARIPIAHISGGEITEGGIDDAIRHSLSKMAYFHFVSAEPYRRRVIQLGEDPTRVMNCGDPGLENLRRLTLLSRDELSARLGIELSRPYFLVTYHPETLTGVSHGDVMDSLFSALDLFPGHGVIITKANADEGGRLINERIDRYAASHPARVYASTSLGQVVYSSAMRHCAAVVGNSSSGIVEAPASLKPTVNIGTRQAGRLMADSVICCGHATDEIASALARAVSPEFQSIAARTTSIYGHSETSVFIKDFLKNADLRGVVKRFHDLPGPCTAEISR